MQMYNQKINIVYSSSKITPLLERLYRVLSAGEFDQYYTDMNKDIHVYVSHMNINLDIRFIPMKDFQVDEVKKEQFYILDFDKEHGKTYEQFIYDIGLNKNVIILVEKVPLGYVNGLTEKITYTYCLGEDQYVQEKDILACSLHTLRTFYSHLTDSDNVHDVFISYRGRDAEWRDAVKKITESFRLKALVDKEFIQNDIPEIFEKMEQSIGMIVLYHDTYGASYYTVEEISHARNHLIPMALIQTGEMELTRVLQQTGNLKMFLSPKKIPIDLSIYKALIHILYTSITKTLMNMIVNQEENVHYLPFQPTLYDISNENLFKSDQDELTIEHIVYPEPIMFKTEREKFEKIVAFLRKDKYELKTILQYQMYGKQVLKSDDTEILKKPTTIHFSVSNIDHRTNPINQRIEYQMIDFLKLTIKYLLDADNRIAYMGSLLSVYVPNYTKIIFNAIGEYNNQFLKTENKANHDIMLFVASHQLRALVEKEESIQLDYGVRWQEIETKDDADGRDKFVDVCDVLFVIGGKEKKARDDNSGIIVEILTYFKKKKPIFLISNFGGASEAWSLFLRAVIEQKIPYEIAYKQYLQTYVKSREDFEAVFWEISQLSSVGAFYNNTLDEEELSLLENKEQNYYEKIHLIIKGVNQCQNS